MLRLPKCKSGKNQKHKNSLFFHCTYKVSKRFQISKKQEVFFQLTH